MTHTEEMRWGHIHTKCYYQGISLLNFVYLWLDRSIHDIELYRNILPSHTHTNECGPQKWQQLSNILPMISTSAVMIKVNFLVLVLYYSYRRGHHEGYMWLFILQLQIPGHLQLFQNKNFLKMYCNYYYGSEFFPFISYFKGY